MYGFGRTTWEHGKVEKCLEDLCRATELGYDVKGFRVFALSLIEEVAL